MENYLPFLVPLFFIAFVTFAIVMIVYSFYLARKRRDTIALIAPRMGFSFNERDDSFRSKHDYLKMFSRGHSHRLINVLQGERDGITVMLADYHYTTGSGKNSTHHSQTLCVISDASMQLPNFYLRQENKFFDYLGKLFGGQDINFPDDEAFSSAFVLQGTKESETRYLFKPEVRKAFMRFAGTSNQIEGQDDSLIIHRSTVLEPEKFSELLKDAFEIYHALKPTESNFLN